MAATVAVLTQQNGPNSITPQAPTYTAMHATDGIDIPYTPGDQIWVFSAVGAKTVTVTSIADSRLGRTRDITAFALTANVPVLLPYMDAQPWRNSSGYVHAVGTDANVQVAVVRPFAS